ncbi:hypothetical protein [Demequina iriomotensis]|uniref:hypothetical protein n=1 Tax=Demequina iriomotensis TaxID=1536641 RepID=UPI000780DF63|nr:hypothetical protein [Demequina iriomotensis]
MTAAGDRGVVPLPAGSTLLHIGLPKSGTTAVQSAAHRLRGQLLQMGVCYPGRNLNHIRAGNALMGRATAVTGSRPISEWLTVRDELRSHPGCIGWISYEQIVLADDDAVARFRAELGPETHVVITGRSYPSMFASAWQQWIKDAGDVPFAEWLEAVLGPVPHEGAIAGFWRRHDLPGIARRWAEALGPDHVSVVVLDKERPNLLFEAFEQMLSLPPRTLSDVPRNALNDNRSLSRMEAELLAGANVHYAASPRPPRRDDYYRLMKTGAVSAILRKRVPGEHEDRIVAHESAARRIAERGAQAASELEHIGVRIIGDVAVLSEMPGRVAAAAPSPFARVDVDLAALAVAGAVSSGLGEGIDFDTRGRRAAEPGARRRVGARAAAAELARRALGGTARA